MNVAKHYTSPKNSPRRKIWVPIDIFKTNKLLRTFEGQLKIFQYTLNRSLAFAKIIPALLYSGSPTWNPAS
jgi:hypothetical protein